MKSVSLAGSSRVLVKSALLLRGVVLALRLTVSWRQRVRSCRREESQCRFCNNRLPDWKKRMTPANVTPCATAVMAVVLNGQEHRITVEPGRAGRRQFEKEIRRLFSLSQEDELEFTFDCQAPSEAVSQTGASLKHVLWLLVFCCFPSLANTDFVVSGCLEAQHRTSRRIWEPALAC